MLFLHLSIYRYCSFRTHFLLLICFPGNVFLYRGTGRIKLLSLSIAAGSYGLGALTSVIFDREAGGANCADALGLLRGVLVHEESDKFVYVKQVAGEDEVECCHRDEKFGRGCNCVTDKNIRTRLSVSIAVNGLRDSEWWKQLTAKADLTWDRFCTLSKSKALSLMLLLL